MSDADLYTCVSTCKICGAELDRATGVPEEHRNAVSVSAPAAMRCASESHNSHENLNVNIKLTWYRETLNGLEFLETIEAPGIELQ